MEEFKAEGLTEEELLAFWENDNKQLQPHKFHNHFHLNPNILQKWWPLKDIHEFCLKHCAIYAIVKISFKPELAEYLWTKWFRKDTPCRFGNFFARFVGAYNPESPKMVPELLEAHRYRAYDVYEDHENYRLEATFHAVFIIMDIVPPLDSYHKRSLKDRELAAATPVLLVRTGEFHDLRTGPVDFASIETVSEEVDGNANVRRILLGHAVDFILDLQRRNSEIDWLYVE
ncbi:MAG: hypothetical protein Q9171_004728 [Xanthocarpia ochracea]